TLHTSYLRRSLDVVHAVYYMPFSSSPAATPGIYTLSLHDALPISRPAVLSSDALRDRGRDRSKHPECAAEKHEGCYRFRSGSGRDRKSTRLNSSHGSISYAVFCLKKKNRQRRRSRTYPSQNTRAHP